MFGDFVSPVVCYVVFDPLVNLFLCVALFLVFLCEFCVEVSRGMFLFPCPVLLCVGVVVEAVFLV